MTETKCPFCQSGLIKKENPKLLGLIEIDYEGLEVCQICNAECKPGLVR